MLFNGNKTKGRKKSNRQSWKEQSKGNGNIRTRKTHTDKNDTITKRTFIERLATPYDFFTYQYQGKTNQNGKTLFKLSKTV
jgi:hypothetical protein